MSNYDSGTKEELEVAIKALAQKIGLEPPYLFEELIKASYHYLYPDGVKPSLNRKERRKK